MALSRARFSRVSSLNLRRGARVRGDGVLAGLRRGRNDREGCNGQEPHGGDGDGPKRNGQARCGVHSALPESFLGRRPRPYREAATRAIEFGDWGAWWPSAASAVEGEGFGRVLRVPTQCLSVHIRIADPGRRFYANSVQQTEAEMAILKKG